MKIDDFTKGVITGSLWIVIVLLLVCCFRDCAKAEIVSRFDGSEYMIRGDVTLMWDVVPNATRYEVECNFKHPVNPSLDMIISCGTVTTNRIVIHQPRAGFFIFKVRACDAVECSTWADTINYLEANGVPGNSFRIYWTLPEPVVVIE
jgi:hypothetical protein